MRGFKSFPHETEIVLDKSMNCVVGPNGSGKSNVTDAICFVLGRLSSKSMRAAKSSNMIFAGTKIHKPANEASVELVLDNSDKRFSLVDQEVSIKRIVRRNGQSIYKLNNNVKTRQEILELLAQAGIDPYGFNIVLQGEIDSFVKMHPEERRKIIEEVAGISIYETRKQKSLRELEKTEEKLKEVSAVLRERTAYLKNLENERQQALKFKKLEETVKKCRASILKRRLDDKIKEKEVVADEISKKNNELEKIKALILKVQEEIKNLNLKIEEINNKIQKSSGLEQETLHKELAELRAEIAGLSVRKENYQTQTEAAERRKQELEKNIKNYEREIEEMRKSKGKSRKQDFINKKNALDELEEKRKKFYSYKSSLDLLHGRIDDKKRQIQRTEQESSFVLEKIEELEKDLKFKESLEKNKELLLTLKGRLDTDKKEQSDNEKSILEVEKDIAVFKKQIEELESIKVQVAKIDICPLCKTKITSEHVNHIEQDSREKISSLEKSIQESEKRKNSVWDLKESLIIRLKENLNEIEKREKDILRLESINEKKQNLRRLEQEKTGLLTQLETLENDKNKLEKTLLQFKGTEENYDSLKLEVQELARHEEANVGMEITLKERELERMKLIIKQSLREKQELEQELLDISSELDGKESLIEGKEKQEQALQIKFKKMFEEKTKHQDKIRMFESDLLKKQNDLRLVEDSINNLKIKTAEFNAHLEGISLEYKEFESIEIIKLPIAQLQEKLDSTQNTLNTLGTVNLRALEVYNDIKKEYDSIADKVAQLEKEKLEIMKIIEEIDNKKKRTFNKTLHEINSLFSRNFSQLSTKGISFLELENKEDIFSGGLDIIIRVGKGKYFDVTSLSGGEQTLIALSLIFAIQEYSPYAFYIFDEIDAALDKRNSERLAVLLKKHMRTGQCLVITHNDALISESSTIYGVSMQEGVSKVLSLQI